VFFFQPFTVQLNIFEQGRIQPEGIIVFAMGLERLNKSNTPAYFTV